MKSLVARSRRLPYPSSKLKTILGIGSEAQLELLQINFASWRSSLVGASLMNLTVAWVFKLFSPVSPLWCWASLGWISCIALAFVCLWYEKVPSNPSARACWLAAGPLMSLAVGVLWSSLPWWLPPAPAIQLLAALAAVMVALGSASASVSVGTLFGVCLPMLLVVPAAMFWHAHLPVAGVVIAALQLIIWKHGLVLHRNMLATIEQRREVECLSKQLEVKQDELRTAERERGVMGERQRLLRDMHDGVGASLVSALKMIEYGAISPGDVAQVLRECLDDLRLAIDSMECIDEDIQTLLATLRYRLGDRIERSGIACEWSVEDVPSLPWLHAPQALEVVRILQEALANVLKHSRSTQVQVSLRFEETAKTGAAVALRIQDNGIGFDTSTAAGGRGLRHMKERALQINSRVEITSILGEGCCFCLSLPVSAASPATSDEGPV